VAQQLHRGDCSNRRETMRWHGGKPISLTSGIAPPHLLRLSQRQAIAKEHLGSVRDFFYEIVPSIF
jgi:hypothetical protein